MISTLQIGQMTRCLQQDAPQSSKKGVGFYPTPTTPYLRRMKRRMALKAVSVRSVAKLAGVHPCDVSHYLNGKKNKVGQETVGKIRAALRLRRILPARKKRVGRA